MKETEAKGKKGYLLYSPIAECPFFRIYHGDDERGDFTDYNIHAEEIEIEIIGDWTSLYEGEKYNKLDFSSKALGRKITHEYP
jgi:hypothetical protein